MNKLSKALLLPVSIFPLAAILNGIGYTLEKLDIPSLHFIAIILKILGSTILNNMPMLFSISISYELSKNKSRFSAFNGMYAFIIITSLLSADNVAIYEGITSDKVDLSFIYINNQFVGILSGLVAVFCYNQVIKHEYTITKKTFNTLVFTTLSMILVSITFYFLWPITYNSLVSLGTFISDKGALGAGLYAFVNRLLIPFGMHHAVNSVFWFDAIGINDVGKFWSSEGVYGVTGMYQSGFYPIMMFGLPAAALAMYKTLNEEQKKKNSAFYLSAGIASFFTGVTEPLEFSFIFVAPKLYLLHAFLTGLCVYIAAAFQWIAGFSFSAGLIDFLLSLNMPMTREAYMLIILGVIIFIIYYFLFTYFIKKFNILTIGSDKTTQIGLQEIIDTDRVTEIVDIIIENVGGIENIKSVDCCTTRLRLQLYNPLYFNFYKIKETGASEYKQFNDEYQIIYGLQVDLIYTKIEEKVSYSK